MRERQKKDKRENGKPFKCEVVMNSIQWAWDRGKWRSKDGMKLLVLVSLYSLMHFTMWVFCFRKSYILMVKYTALIFLYSMDPKCKTILSSRVQPKRYQLVPTVKCWQQIQKVMVCLYVVRANLRDFVTYFYYIWFCFTLTCYFVPVSALEMRISTIISRLTRAILGIKMR